MISKNNKCCASKCLLLNDDSSKRLSFRGESRRVRARFLSDSKTFCIKSYSFKNFAPLPTHLILVLYSLSTFTYQIQFCLRKSCQNCSRNLECVKSKTAMKYKDKNDVYFDIYNVKGNNKNNKERFNNYFEKD